MNKSRYEFRTANGKICCSSDVAEYLCDACRSQIGLPPLRAASATSERHASAAKPTSDAERLAKRLQGYGTIVTETPDPYAPATLRAAERADALEALLHDKSIHDLRGQPMSGYDFALALRKAEVQR